MFYWADPRQFYDVLGLIGFFNLADVLRTCLYAIFIDVLKLFLFDILDWTKLQISWELFAWFSKFLLYNNNLF